MNRWWLHAGSLMRYDPMNPPGGFVWITDVWPPGGGQHWIVRLYSDSRGRNEIDRERFPDLAAAVQRAEGWLP